jgi:hypothetical protein
MGYVCTASIYVENAHTPEEATKFVEEVNNGELGFTGNMPIHVRLPDNVLIGPEGWDEGDHIWEKYSD